MVNIGEMKGCKKTNAELYIFLDLHDLQQNGPQAHLNNRITLITQVFAFLIYFFKRW